MAGNTQYWNLGSPCHLVHTQGAQTRTHPIETITFGLIYCTHEVHTHARAHSHTCVPQTIRCSWPYIMLLHARHVTPRACTKLAGSQHHAWFLACAESLNFLVTHWHRPGTQTHARQLLCGVHKMTAHVAADKAHYGRHHERNQRVKYIAAAH